MIHNIKRFADIETVANRDIFTNGDYGWDTIDLYYFDVKPTLAYDGQLRLRIRLTRHVQSGGERMDITDTLLELKPHGQSRLLMDYEFDRSQYRAINRLQEFLNEVVDTFADLKESR